MFLDSLYGLQGRGWLDGEYGYGTLLWCMRVHGGLEIYIGEMQEALIGEEE